MRQVIITACGIIIAIALGISPLFFALAYHSSELNELALALTLNSVGWILVALGLLIFHHLGRMVNKEAVEWGLTVTPGGLYKKLRGMLRELKRWQSASYMFYQHDAKSQSEVGKSLRRIVELAYRELPAKAVQLVLYDNESQKSTQTMMMGTPSVFSSQGLGDGEIEATTTSDRLRAIPPNAIKGEIDGQPLGPNVHIVDEPVLFAGTQFGVLRIELKPGALLSKSDRQVLYLLASQGALLLINSRFTDELLRMKRIGEETMRAKTGFLATLSHEIRGPLGIVLNGVELVNDGFCGPVSDAQKETLSMVKKSGDHLLDLVNDVLDYAKAESGNELAKPIPISIGALLKDLANVVRSQAQKKSHKIKVEPVDQTLGMMCDKRHSRQILINFLTNAIKYTPDGGTITLKAQRVRSHRVLISVVDTGIGIPKEQWDRVFRPFERVEDNYAKQQIGTGLGMALSQKLAEVNGGKIGFDSVVGTGSTFWIEMPSCAIENIAQGEGSETEEIILGREERVLLVDPALPSRQVVENYLSEQKFQLILASSGSEVMRIVKDQKLDLAIVENELDDLPGAELVKIIRTSANCSKVPIILVSSHAFSFDIEHFLRMGVDRCLSKPVGLRELALTIRQVIDENAVAEATSTSIVEQI